MSQSVAVVTGASQGIGHSTADRLARDFSSIALVARNRGRRDCNPPRMLGLCSLQRNLLGATCHPLSPLLPETEFVME
jgi:NAD(P)-dependent dehydrogenase (short-subunit alcohol dehydrogenase family)